MSRPLDLHTATNAPDIRGMEKTKMKGWPLSPPAIHGKVARWVNLQDIESNMGVVHDELNLHVGDLSKHIKDAAYVKHSGLPVYVQMQSGIPVKIRGVVVAVDARMVDSAVARGVMRPDVAIIDPINKTWRITGQ